MTPPTNTNTLRLCLCPHTWLDAGPTIEYTQTLNTDYLHYFTAHREVKERMSATATVEQRKRARPEDDSSPLDAAASDFLTRPTKVLSSAILDAEKPSRFLNFHLKVLRSLYDTARSDGEDDVKDSTPAGLWQTMQDFLRDRVQILESKQQASTWSGIREEATRMADTAPVHSSSVLSAPSPVQPFYTTMAGVVQPPSQLSSSALMATPTKAAIPTASGNSFQIVAHLLGKRAAKTKRSYQMQKDAYKPLAESTQRRIDDLQDELTTLQQTMADQKRVPVDYKICTQNALGRDQVVAGRPATDETTATAIANLNQLAALQTKIRLWTLFAADLKDIL